MKNNKNFKNTCDFENLYKKIRELRELLEGEFDERICELFKEVISKKGKPCRYLYEMQPWRITDGDDYAYFDEWPRQTTTEVKIDSAEHFYGDPCGFIGKGHKDLKLCCPVLRVPLFKIDTKLIKKYFNCDSLKRFFVLYGKRYGRQYFEEEYFEHSGFKLVYSNDNEAYIGLEDTILKDVAFKIERCEQVFDLEFEDD